MAPFTSKIADSHKNLKIEGVEKQAVSLRNGPEKQLMSLCYGLEKQADGLRSILALYLIEQCTQGFIVTLQRVDRGLNTFGYKTVMY